MTEIKSNGDLIGTLLERALGILTTPFTVFSPSFQNQYRICSQICKSYKNADKLFSIIHNFPSLIRNDLKTYYAILGTIPTFLAS